MTRAILHLDMDAFYASVEQCDHPAWRGRPVVVGADPAEGRGRGVVAACSYEARAFGVRSALPIGRAWRLCPQGVFVRPRMARYAEVSRSLFALLREYTDLVEPLSIDEAFLDVTGSRRLWGDAERIGREIKGRVQREWGLVASVGVAPNKFLAKVASDLEKPDGFVVVRLGEERSFLEPLPIGRLWGVGPKTEERLRRVGLRTIGDVARLRPEDLEPALGEHAGDLIALARGEDSRPVAPDAEPRSLGAETTFERDTDDLEAVRRTLLGLADRVGSRLRGEGLRTARVTLKHRDETFHTITRSQALSRPTDLTEDLYAAALVLLDRVPHRGRRVRLVGLTATHLGGTRAAGAAQLDLFAPPPRPDRLGEVSRVVDEIRRQFGPRAITRAALLPEGDGDPRPRQRKKRS
ncbi:MAG: DNA polymerase IV [Deltaproteobacteria bacterium]|nr:DNA polymerase IV [Deltaproteobacteria bacterium]